MVEDIIKNMNQQQLQQKIIEYYEKLPQEAQEVFSSMAWLEKLEEISKKYNLSAEQIQTLGTETMLVLLGIIHLEEYENLLKTEIKIPEDSIEAIFTEINESVLKNIIPKITEVFYKNNQNIKDVEESNGVDLENFKNNFGKHGLLGLVIDSPVQQNIKKTKDEIDQRNKKLLELGLAMIEEKAKNSGKNIDEYISETSQNLKREVNEIVDKEKEIRTKRIEKENEKNTTKTNQDIKNDSTIENNLDIEIKKLKEEEIGLRELYTTKMLEYEEIKGFDSIKRKLSEAENT